MKNLTFSQKAPTPKSSDTFEPEKVEEVRVSFFWLRIPNGEVCGG